MIVLSRDSVDYIRLNTETGERVYINQREYNRIKRTCKDYTDCIVLWDRACCFVVNKYNYTLSAVHNETGMNIGMLSIPEIDTRWLNLRIEVREPSRLVLRLISGEEWMLIYYYIHSGKMTVGGKHVICNRKVREQV